MDIYVESRTKHVDYYWVSQSTAPEKVHNVPRIIQSVTKFNEDKDLKLIHESEPSIVLLRSQGELLLFVSGLQTKRQDKDRRYIRNSIAWVGEKTDEPILRNIAALVLENNLQILENLVVESSNSSGELFEVNWQAIEQLIPPNVGVKRILPKQNENGKIARTSESRTQEIANELRQYDLPVRDGALVAVTMGFKPTAIFARANVWRGLSNNPEASNEWLMLTPSDPVNVPPPKSKILRLVMIAGILIILAVSAYLVSKNKQKKLCQEPKQMPQLIYKEQPISNNAVGLLKSTLKKLDAPYKQQKNQTIEDNISFDSDTKEAVKYFQSQYKDKYHVQLNQKGDVDTATWEALAEITNNSEHLEKLCIPKSSHFNQDSKKSG